MYRKEVADLNEAHNKHVVRNCDSTPSVITRELLKSPHIRCNIAMRLSAGICTMLSFSQNNFLFLSALYTLS